MKNLWFKAGIIGMGILLSGAFGLPIETVEPGKRLFILSGQSNMAGLDPALSFTPTVAAAFGESNVIVVKNARSGQPIRRWYKDWKPKEGMAPETNGDLYAVLLAEVKEAIAHQEILSVTFLWMQGERDAKEGHGEVYAESLAGLIDQLRRDLGRADLYFVIGRLSDYGVKKDFIPHWTLVREAQMQVANANQRGDWVDTDDLNDGLNEKGEAIENDLHYSVEGYRIFGKRLAAKAIDQIRSAKSNG